MSNNFLEVGIELTSIPEIREITWLTNGCIILLSSRAKIWTQSDMNVWFLSMWSSFLVISLILVLIIWWCPWVKLSLVLLKRVFDGREVGRGFRMGNTCKFMADSCQVWQKLLKYFKVISLQQIKINRGEKRVFAMTSVFSGRILLDCPALFCSPRPNLPVTTGISWLPTFAFQSSMMNRHLFFFPWC